MVVVDMYVSKNSYLCNKGLKQLFFAPKTATPNASEIQRCNSSYYPQPYALACRVEGIIRTIMYELCEIICHDSFISVDGS